MKKENIGKGLKWLNGVTAPKNPAYAIGLESEGLKDGDGGSSTQS
jgi:hypothetical protein